MSSTIDSLDFQAYCRTFEIMGNDPTTGSSWAKQICGDYNKDLYEDWKIFRDNFGDGTIEFSEPDSGYPEIHYQRRFFTQDGQFVKYAQEPAHQIDSTISRYFIAGAFGVHEQKGNIYLNPEIVTGLHELYSLCQGSPSTCLDSTEAKKLRALLQKGLIKTISSEDLIKYYNMKTEELTDLVHKEEPWYRTRFSEALESGLACLSSIIPKTVDESLALAKKRYELAKGLLQKVKTYPEKEVCIDSETICNPAHEKPSHSEGRFGHSGSFDSPSIGSDYSEKEECHSHCIKKATVGHDYTPEELMTFSAEMCSQASK